MARKGAPVAGPWISHLLGRFGFLARGVVYLVVGSVAARVAVLQRGRATGPAGALEMILSASYGRIALEVVTAGLFSFALYRLAQAKAARSRLGRVGPAVSAIGILLLAFTSVQLLRRVRPGSDGAVLRLWGRRILDHEWGGPMLAAGGAVAVAVGAVEVVRALLGRLPADYTGAIIARERKRWATRLARIGLLAHGVVVATAGFSILHAGLHADSRALVGTSGALRKLRLVQGGPALFAVVAVGLVAHGLSLLVLAAHRRKKVR